MRAEDGQQVTASELAHLMKRFGIRVPAQQRVFALGEPASALFYMVSGRVRVCVQEDRGERSLSVVEAGGFFGAEAMQPGATRHAFAEAVTEVELLRLPGELLTALVAAHPSVARTLLSAFAEQSTQLERRAALLAMDDPHARLLACLTQAVARSPRPTAEVTLKETPLSLAAQLGLHVDQVLALVKQLENAGKIALEADRLRIFPARLLAEPPRRPEKPVAR